MNRRLTVNYGVRWEPFLPVYSKYGQFDHFNQTAFTSGTKSSVYVNAPAGLSFPGDPQYTAGNSLSETRWGKFAPRIGLVYDPKGDGRMTVRASYGLFYDRYHMFGLNFVGQEPPFGNNIVLPSANLSNPWSAYPGGNPFPITVTKTSTFPTAGGYVSFPLDYRQMYLNQWNLSVQRQAGKDWLLTINYLGNSTLLGADSVGIGAILHNFSARFPMPRGGSALSQSRLFGGGTVLFVTCSIAVTRLSHRRPKRCWLSHQSSPSIEK